MPFKIQFSWKMTFAILRRLTEHTFAFEEDDPRYGTTAWARWVKRIKNGHEEEVIALKKQQKKWEAEGYQIYNYSEYGEEALHEHQSMSLLTNSMYAALVVTLWADVESYLKSLVEACSVALQKKNAPYKFEDIEKFFIRELKIDFKTLDSYKTINAIRILNNSFKHNHGNYKPTDKEHTQIDATLLNTWKIIQEDKRVNYSKLPIKDLVLACGKFHKVLIQEVERKLITIIEKTDTSGGLKQKIREASA